MLTFSDLYPIVNFPFDELHFRKAGGKSTSGFITETPAHRRRRIQIKNDCILGKTYLLSDGLLSTDG
jgi:hypothetical protein